MTLLAIFIALFLVELLYFRIADRLNIVDKPNERSSHCRVTLRGGGIVFPIAALTALGLGGFAYPLFAAGLILVSVVSFLDDIKPLPNKIRIAVHFLSGFILLAQLGVVQQYPLFVPLLLVVCAGIINAFNFMDGINGITGAYCTVILAALVYVNRAIVPFTDPNLPVIVLLSLLVFNYFNFRFKAVCFAGDVGSVSIAFIILFFLGQLILKTNNPAWIGMLSVYGVDSVLTILHRLRLRENIFRPHRKHLYQLLANELKVPHLLVSTSYAFMQAVVIVGLVLCGRVGDFAVWLWLGVTTSVLVGIYVGIKNRWFHLHLRDSKNESY